MGRKKIAQDRETVYVGLKIADTDKIKLTSAADRLGFNNMSEIQSALNGGEGKQIIENIEEYEPVDKFLDEAKVSSVNKGFGSTSDKIDSAIKKWRDK